MDSEAVAEDFVRARLGAEALLDFPGTIPTTLNTAYAYQDRAIALWPDHLAGWKVGRIGPPWLERVGEDRLVGPIFRRGIRLAPPDALVQFPVFKGGFAAVEAEFVFRLGADAQSDKTQWTPAEAAQLVSGLHVGIEAAGQSARGDQRVGAHGGGLGLRQQRRAACWGLRFPTGVSARSNRSPARRSSTIVRWGGAVPSRCRADRWPPSLSPWAGAPGAGSP